MICDIAQFWGDGPLKSVFGTPPVRKSASFFEYSLSPMECVFVRVSLDNRR